MILKKAFTLSLLFISSLLLLSSCIKKDADRKKELNEILAIARKFKHTRSIHSYELNKYTGQYTIMYDSLYSFTQENACFYCNEKELNKILLTIENVDNMSSQLYLTDFVQTVYYIKEKNCLRISFYKFPFFDENKKGIEWKDGKWREFMIENDKLIYP